MEKVKAGYDKAVEALEKQKATIERHEAQLAKMLEALEKKGADVKNLEAHKYADGRGTELYWDICKVESKQDDIKRAKKAIKDRERIVGEWAAKVVKEEQRNNETSSLPPVILEWAEKYKARVIAWLLEGAAGYRERKEAAYKIEDRDEKRKELREVETAYSSTIKDVAAYYGEARQERAETVAERQKRELLETLVYRVTAKTGTITDASGLHIGGNGEINGLVIGEKGRATVETILAGGWNIQCLHFRVLVK